MALLAIAYVFGHLVQAIANYALKRSGWQPEIDIFNHLPAAIRAALTSRAREAVAFREEEHLAREVIYAIAEHAVLQRGKTDTRDVYVYREGFYRGMAFGLLLLGIGCIGLATRSGGTTAAPSLEVFGGHIAMTPGLLWLVGLIALLMIYYFAERYRRFVEYRVDYTYYSFLVGLNGAADIRHEVLPRLAHADDSGEAREPVVQISEVKL